ncbi:uncharacterized protein LOC110663586 isoform X2 [Hevea brasiliensis]|uniref:uncharacterized protein LOC110663586 isoform X2 n=1 Tax=Hevea brasiliensis TaxID=3981 RepID=UPI0025E44AC7|nr:uncharacterized protein LOC110663586 isoform X2 [Hevea brasiliensis]
MRRKLGITALVNDVVSSCWINKEDDVCFARLFQNPAILIANATKPKALIERERRMEELEKERLNQTFNSYFKTFHETFQTPYSSLDKVSWEEVVKMGDQVYKQATIIFGMFWTEEKTELKAVEENMVTYFNTVQDLLLLSRGSTVGAGPTLSSYISLSLQKVFDAVGCSIKLLAICVSSYGSCDKDLKLDVRRLVGAVRASFEVVCSDLKKTPATNITAIGKEMKQFAVSVKKVLCEMKELKPASSILIDEASDGGPPITEAGLQGEDDDLSPEEMKIAQSAIGVVSETTVVIEELIRTIVGMLDQEKSDNNGSFVYSLEKLLKLCQEIDGEIFELKACLYPPQDVTDIKEALENISRIISEMLAVVESFNTFLATFFQACCGLTSSIKQMETELDNYCTSDIESKMQNVAVSNEREREREREREG